MESLKEIAARAINKNIRFIKRFDVLEKNHMLPISLIKFCRKNYSRHFTDDRSLILKKIKISPTYKFLESIIFNSNTILMSDCIELYTTYYIINEKVSFSTNKNDEDLFQFWSIIDEGFDRYICKRCHDSYYFTNFNYENVTKSLHENVSPVTKFRLMFSCLQFWCHECFKPLFRTRLPDSDNNKLDLVLQIIKSPIETNKFRNKNRNIVFSMLDKTITSFPNTPPNSECEEEM